MLATLIRIIILLAAIALGLGLVLPCMTIVTSFGEYDSWIRLLKPGLHRTREYSVLSGILAMIQGGSVGIGLLLLFFSAIFPTLKLAIMAWAVQVLEQKRSTGWLLEAAHHTGKFSMLDVLVLALIVIAIKGLPGSTEVRLGVGVWLFAGSVIGSLVASILLHRLERRTAIA